GIWPKVARSVQHRPRVIWLVTAVVLLAGAVGVTQLKAEGVAQSELVLGASEARDGHQALGKHFPGGSGSPVQVVAAEGVMERVADVLLSHDGIEDASVNSQDSPSGSARLDQDRMERMRRPGTHAPQPSGEIGNVLVHGRLSDAADSQAASHTVRDLRHELADAAPSALVGGVTATPVDTTDASIDDRSLVIPIILAVT